VNVSQSRLAKVSSAVRIYIGVQIADFVPRRVTTNIHQICTISIGKSKFSGEGNSLPYIQGLDVSPSRLTPPRNDPDPDRTVDISRLFSTVVLKPSFSQSLMATRQAHLLEFDRSVFGVDGGDCNGKADDRRTMKSADFVTRFYRTTKNRPIFVCHTTDFIG